MNDNPHVDTRDLVIIGAGGLGVEFAWVAQEMNTAASAGGTTPFRLLGYADDASVKRGQTIGSLVVRGTIEEIASEFNGSMIYFAVALGSNLARKRAVERAEARGWHSVALVHPSAIIASDASVAPGSYVAPGVVICPRARVGSYVILNTHVSVGHDSVAEDYSQICPGVRISGGCQVGKLAFLGSNASLSPGVMVGDRAVVGANSHAVRAVAPGTTVLGCPAMALAGRGRE